MNCFWLTVVFYVDLKHCSAFSVCYMKLLWWRIVKIHFEQLNDYLIVWHLALGIRISYSCGEFCSWFHNEHGHFTRTLWYCTEHTLSTYTEWERKKHFIKGHFFNLKLDCVVLTNTSELLTWIPMTWVCKRVSGIQSSKRDMNQCPSIDFRLFSLFVVRSFITLLLCVEEMIIHCGQ